MERMDWNGTDRRKWVVFMLFSLISVRAASAPGVAFDFELAGPDQQKFFRFWRAAVGSSGVRWI